MKKLADVLEHYGVKGKVIKINHGPLIEQIEFLPEPGTKIKNIINSLDDIARELGLNSLRVEPVEGSNNLGFEIPADEMKTVDFSQILSSGSFEKAQGDLPICLGVDIRGTPFFADLAKMPHLLIAGTTGSGKSVGLNTFILSLIKTKQPEDLKFVLIDPKRIEFSIYNNQKYMLAPVVTDNMLAAKMLNYLVQEMEKRYELFEQSLAKNIKEYNAKKEEHLPYIVCIIDEFADLIAADKNVGDHIKLLAQKARACGIHIMLATQRPSVDVVTGVLKANFPTRLSYKVASSTDSRTILDTSGAEKLIGRGDCLYLAGNGELRRLHGAYMPDEDVAKMLEPYRSKVKPIIVEKNSEVSVIAAKEPKKKSIFRKILEWWSSLRKRERKTIISGATVGAGWLYSQLKEKNRKK